MPVPGPTARAARPLALRGPARPARAGSRRAGRTGAAASAAPDLPPAGAVIPLCAAALRRVGQGVPSSRSMPIENALLAGAPFRSGARGAGQKKVTRPAVALARRQGHSLRAATTKSGAAQQIACPAQHGQSRQIPEGSVFIHPIRTPRGPRTTFLAADPRRPSREVPTSTIRSPARHHRQGGNTVVSSNAEATHPPAWQDGHRVQNISRRAGRAPGCWARLPSEPGAEADFHPSLPTAPARISVLSTRPSSRLLQSLVSHLVCRQGQAPYTDLAITLASPTDQYRSASPTRRPASMSPAVATMRPLTTFIQGYRDRFPFRVEIPSLCPCGRHRPVRSGAGPSERLDRKKLGAVYIFAVHESTKIVAATPEAKAHVSACSSSLARFDGSPASVAARPGAASLGPPFARRPVFARPASNDLTTKLSRNEQLHMLFHGPPEKRSQSLKTAASISAGQPGQADFRPWLLLPHLGKAARPCRARNAELEPAATSRAARSQGRDLPPIRRPASVRLPSPRRATSPFAPPGGRTARRPRQFPRRSTEILPPVAASPWGRGLRARVSPHGRRGISRGGLETFLIRPNSSPNMLAAPRPCDRPIARRDDRRHRARRPGRCAPSPTGCEVGTISLPCGPARPSGSAVRCPRPSAHSLDDTRPRPPYADAHDPPAPRPRARGRSRRPGTADPARADLADQEPLRPRGELAARTATQRAQDSRGPGAGDGRRTTSRTPIRRAVSIPLDAEWRLVPELAHPLPPAAADRSRGRPVMPIAARTPMPLTGPEGSRPDARRRDPSPPAPARPRPVPRYAQPDHGVGRVGPAASARHRTPRQQIAAPRPARPGMGEPFQHRRLFARLALLEAAATCTPDRNSVEAASWTISPRGPRACRR